MALVFLFVISTTPVVALGHIDEIVFEGTLLAKSDIAICGLVLAPRVAKYKVDHVVSGRYTKREIVVDHIYCGGDDPLKAMPIGTKVRLTVFRDRTPRAIAYYPGIREDDEKPSVFFVTEIRPIVLESRAPRKRHG